jgi:hypothetical protein
MSDSCTNGVACDCDPVFSVTPPNPPPPPIIFWNVEQCATAHCPTGGTSVNIIPQMVSNTVPSGSVSIFSDIGPSPAADAYKPFDRNDATYFETGASPFGSWWIEYDFGATQSFDSYRLYIDEVRGTVGPNGGTVILQGSDDLMIWNDLDTQTWPDNNNVSPTGINAIFPLVASHQNYRWKINHDGDSVKIKSLELLRGTTGSDVTVCVAANLYSSTLSQLDADNQAYIAALNEANAELHCDLAGQLNGLLFLMPALNGANPCTCTNPADQSAIAVGNVGQIYAVQLRVRGLVECKPYTLYGVGGSANNFVFTCSNPTQAIPASPANHDNEYCIVISDPPATLFLNNAPTNVAPTHSQAMDYQLTIHVKTGATITLKVRSIDNLEWRNIANTIVNNAPPAITPAEPYSGQFIQLDVLSVF